MKITEIPVEKIELPQKNDISARKNVEITEIPVEKIELPQKESSIPYTNDSDVKENIPFNPPPHKELEKKKSFFMGSRKSKTCSNCCFCPGLCYYCNRCFFCVVSSWFNRIQLYVPLE